MADETKTPEISGKFFAFGRASENVIKDEITKLDPPWKAVKPNAEGEAAEGVQGDAEVKVDAQPIEDDWSPLYNGPAGTSIIAPPYEPRTLERLAQENNALGPCIDAMVTNVDGTGFDIEPADAQAEDGKDDENIGRLKGFFEEVFPGTSITELRKRLRRDLETTGNAYIEVLRNATGDLVFLRQIEASRVRLLRLDPPINADKEITRNGKTETVTIAVRERRFVQLIAGKPIYFPEFGATRDLNKITGTWHKKGSVPFLKRANEVIHIRLVPDHSSPYGVPRWVCELPSVLGSRKAEEHNLEYFNAGGIPPAMIFIAGGTMGEQTRMALDAKLSQKGAAHRVLVAEVYGTGGTLDKENPVKVTVERFGGEKANDAMFQAYDERCAQRVREAFRLPPLFLGDASSTNFATAYTAYITTEGQMFKPERDRFDEIMTRMILPEIEGTGYVFRSKPLSIKDTQAILSALTIAAGTQAVEPEDIVTTLNEAVGTSLKYKEPPKPIPAPIGPDGKPVVPKEHPMVDPDTGVAPKDTKLSIPTGRLAGVQKVTKDAPEPMLVLALKVSVAARKGDYVAMARLLKQAEGYREHERVLFERLLALHQFGDPSSDLAGAGSIAGCTATVLASNLRAA